MLEPVGLSRDAHSEPGNAHPELDQPGQDGRREVARIAVTTVACRARALMTSASARRSQTSLLPPGGSMNTIRPSSAGA